MNQETRKALIDLVLSGCSDNATTEKDIPTKNHHEELLQVGENYCFHTVTMIEIGRLVKVVGSTAVIEQASWVADTGRYHEFFRDGVISEVEPYPKGLQVCVNLEALIKYSKWTHDLPDKAK